MKQAPLKPRRLFGSVQVARDLLREKAAEILKLYLENAQKAQDAGDYEVANKSLQWLLEHIPADETGERVVATSVDKQIVNVSDNSKPTIQIGIQLGGVGGKQKALPAAKAEVIDAS